MYHNSFQQILRSNKSLLVSVPRAAASDYIPQLLCRGYNQTCSYIIKFNYFSNEAGALNAGNAGSRVALQHITERWRR